MLSVSSDLVPEFRPSGQPAGDTRGSTASQGGTPACEQSSDVMCCSSWPDTPIRVDERSETTSNWNSGGDFAQVTITQLCEGRS